MVAALANCVAIVYTNAPKQPREAIFADLCTLLRRCPRGGQSGRVRRRARAQGAQRAGKRQDRRRGRDAAVGVGRPVPRGGGIVLVWDNSSTHPVGSPCETFPPRKAERLASRLKVRHTLRHVSCQLTEQGHPARAISPKPARARICRQRCSRSPQSIIQPIVPGTSPGPLM